jgi:hypothetical protein
MSVKEVDRALRGLPVSERIAALILSLSERNADSIAAIGGLIATASIIGSNLGHETDRRRAASCMRECATHVEAEHVPLLKDQPHGR